MIGAFAFRIALDLGGWGPALGPLSPLHFGVSSLKLSKSPSSAWDQPGLAGVLRWGPPSLNGDLRRLWSLFVLIRHSLTLSSVCGVDHTPQRALGTQADGYSVGPVVEPWFQEGGLVSRWFLLAGAVFL